MLDVLDARSQAGKRAFGSQNNDDFRDAGSFLQGQLENLELLYLLPRQSMAHLQHNLTPRLESVLFDDIAHGIPNRISRYRAVARRVFQERQHGFQIIDCPLAGLGWWLPVDSPYDPSLQLDRIDVASVELKSGSRKKYVDVSAISFNLTILGCALAHFGHAE